MLKLKKIEYKNFQSVGNHPITIQLDRSTTTVVGGKNGTGKSTLWLALGYGLFGKLLSKDAKLDEVVNSVNKKALLVKVWFSVNEDEYVVERGMKPGKFEIYKNGDMLPQDAKSKDYQKTLDKIIGMEFNTFVQVIMLNKERFKPFMEMSAAERRVVVENILDISIFSDMMNSSKDSLKELKWTERDIENNRSKLETRVYGQERLINEIEKTISEGKEDKQKDINEIKETISVIEKQIKEKEADRDTLVFDSLPKIKASIREMRDFNSKMSGKVSVEESTLKFFDSNENCPTCEQELDVALKQSKIVSAKEKIKGFNDKVDEVKGIIRKLTKKEESLEEAEGLYRTLNSEISNLNTKKHTLEDRLKGIERSLEDSSKEDSLEGEVTLLKEMMGELETLRESEISILDDISIAEQTQALFRDDTIKADIVNEYIGYINKKVNEYLVSMDFYIGMQLDENFNESFKALHKEKFTCGNLSTGQKCRVNLAIWLSLLEVASMKNSINCNFLALDEILENLDYEGVQSFMRLCDNLLYDKNIFVVTQRFEEFSEYFRSSIKFKLNEGFTEIE